MVLLCFIGIGQGMLYRKGMERWGGATEAGLHLVKPGNKKGARQLTGKAEVRTLQGAFAV